MERDDISLTMRDLRISPAPAPTVSFRTAPTLPASFFGTDDGLSSDIESFLLGVDLVATLDSPFPESPKTPTPASTPTGYRTVGAVTYNTMRPLGTARPGPNLQQPKVYEGFHDAFGTVAVQVLNKRTHRLYNPDIEKLRRATIVPQEPPLLRFHGFVEDESSIYAISEIGGYNLIEYTSMLRSSHKLALPLLLDLSKRILRVVAEMHAWGICHKNIKPTKIFIRPLPARKLNQNDDDEQDTLLVKIGGVGVAATNSSGMEVWGTPVWRAPELNLGPTGANSTACDIYSCGLVLACLLLRPQYVPVLLNR
jgi:serine/threonine protein kinase